VNELVFDYDGIPLRAIRMGTLLRQFATIVRQHAIVLPADLTLMFKAIVTLEGLGRQYDPDFHITDHLTPWLQRALRERYLPAAMVRRGRHTVADFFNVLGSVPRDFARLLREARRGKTRVDLDLKRLDSFGQQLDRTLDRTTVGILTASLVIGSSIVLTIAHGPAIFGVPVLPVLGLAGFVLAFVNSLWIIYGIWRSGKR
jgi:ubiquinone biosynthesis protein